MATSGTRSNSSESSRKDPCWKYVRLAKPPSTNDLICNFCEITTKGGIYRAKQHVVGGFQNSNKCKKCPPHVEEEVKTYMAAKAKAKNVVISDQDYFNDSNEVEEEEDLVTPRTQSLKRRGSKGPLDIYFAPNVEKIVKGKKQLKQATINELCKKELREKTCRDICRWIYDTAIPFNALKHPSFAVMVESIGQFGPGLKPPSYHEARVPFLVKEVSDVNELVREYQSEWARYGCSIMCDGWTDKRQRTLINFLVNSPKGTVFLESVDASEYSKTGEQMAKLLERIVERVGEANVVQVITDNASSNVVAGRLLMAKYRHLFWTLCAAHCIDLMLEDIGKIPQVKNTIRRAISLNAYIYVRPGVVNMLRKFTGHVELVRHGVTRFATAFLTLERMHKQKNNLRKMFTSDEWTSSKWGKEANGKKATKIVLISSFWSSVVYILKIFGPLVHVLRLVDGERKPPMGYIYEAIERAKDCERE